MLGRPSLGPGQAFGGRPSPKPSPVLLEGAAPYCQEVRVCVVEQCGGTCPDFLLALGREIDLPGLSVHHLWHNCSLDYL